MLVNVFERSLNMHKLQQIGFKSIFFRLPQQYFVPTMCIYKQGNIIYTIDLIAVISQKMYHTFFTLNRLRDVKWQY